jgi:medium-chain acyl-[acyl-carrier-protein] hydrolase
MKLICYSYAGGSASMYNKWKDLVDASIEIFPMEYAGRGSRAMEPLYATFEHLVEDMFEQTCKILSKHEEYALFGHSMGGLVTYELYKRLLEAGFSQPQHVFLSARENSRIRYFKGESSPR